MIARRGVVLTRKELLGDVLGYQSTTTRTVDVHVAALRQELEDDPRSPRFILTARGKGYKFCG
jgi:two-component system alkaline phosphatase synthesis response regulator PhoP